MCPRCGAALDGEPSAAGDAPLCPVCAARTAHEANAERDRIEAFADSVVVTTSPGVNRYRIERQVGHERISFVTEGGLISEFTAEFYGLLGQRAGDAHGQLRSRQHPAIRALMLRAARQGANAVINVELTYEGHTGERARYILSGTLVLLVPNP
ncbi:MAG TPA: heavy metal-binding domain-containing protein [Gemmatimonadales bacterium]|nr:heavy metal-binding domain-containing protein [Gemmatimonadales bacterium]